MSNNNCDLKLVALALWQSQRYALGLSVSIALYFSRSHDLRVLSGGRDRHSHPDIQLTSRELCHHFSTRGDFKFTKHTLQSLLNRILSNPQLGANLGIRAS
jgi:hypothetical protein